LLSGTVSAEMKTGCCCSVILFLFCSTLLSCRCLVSGFTWSNIMIQRSLFRSKPLLVANPYRSFSVAPLSISGLVAVYKPPDWTSADVTNKWKDILGKGLNMRKKDVKVGHGGTLDPIAEGILVLGIADGTKQLTSYLEGRKEYQVVAKLGTATDSFDSTGKVTETKDASFVTKELLESALSSFRGNILQLPPMHSAIKINGTRLYELARKGEEVQRERRQVSVFRLQPIDEIPEVPEAAYDASLPFFTRNDINPNPDPHAKVIHLPDSFGLELECSSGFYVRTLVDEVARKMNTVAHMTYLRRSRQGQFGLEDCLFVKDWEFEKIMKHLEFSQRKFHQHFPPADNSNGRADQRRRSFSNNNRGRSGGRY
jgi:tRNA pseudouridine55 synthase